MENNVSQLLAGTCAVKELRLKKLHNGHPFMINSRELPNRQCYLEFPDKTIKLVTISASGFDFEVLRVLSESECKLLRQKYNLADA